MTSPKHATSTNRGRQYRNPVTGRTYPSVTTILGQIGKGEALKWWAAGEVARYAVEHRDTWANLDPQAAIDLLKREPLRSLNRAADRGTDVHAIADHYSKTGEIGDMERHTGYVAALVKFFDEHQPLPVLAEYTVFAEMGYAGSFDMVCRLPALNDALVVLDYKTSKAVYPDTAAQLAAYAHADQYIDENDHMHDMPKVDSGVIVRLAANGEYQLVQADLATGWQLFQAAFAIHQAQQNQLLIGDVPSDHSHDTRPLRENLIERVQYIRDNHPEQMSVLQGQWIRDIAPLSQFDRPITRHQLAILERVITQVETEVSAPFNPAPAAAPPPRRTAPVVEATQPSMPGDDIPVAAHEVDIIRGLVNAAAKPVKDAIRATTQEAQRAKTTLSLNGKPTIRRAACAHLMLDVYTADHSDDRAYMRTLLQHCGYWHTDIGTSLGRLDLPEISKLGETHNSVQDGTLALSYNPETDSFVIGESSNK